MTARGNIGIHRGYIGSYTHEHSTFAVRYYPIIDCQIGNLVMLYIILLITYLTDFRLVKLNLLMLFISGFNMY